MGGNMEGARELPKMIVRMPQEVKERLQRSAKTSLRSMNSEILGRLLRSLEEDEAQQDGKQK
jgi:predicted HicB family RNase H-like nuclease